MLFIKFINIKKYLYCYSKKIINIISKRVKINTIYKLKSNKISINTVSFLIT